MGVSVMVRRSVPRSRQAYAGGRWGMDGRLRAKAGRAGGRGTRLRAKPVRSAASGPTPGRTPLTSCSSALAAPRYGVPSVISLRVTAAPPQCSRYQRATRPPIEWHTSTTWASAYGPPWARHRSRAGSIFLVMQRAVCRWGSRQSYASGSRLPGGAPAPAPGLAVAERAQAPQQQVVALDRGPDAGQGVQVGHQPAGLDAVAGVVIVEAVGEGE